MTTDSRILPPNFSLLYHLQSVDGYDPLYLSSYGKFIAASERAKADISPPFGFNRIITPHNYNSRLIDLLGVKYILSLSPITSENLKKVFQEGETLVYENKKVMPRAFFVQSTLGLSDEQQMIQTMYDKQFDFYTSALIHDSSKIGTKDTWSIGSVNIDSYTPNKVTITTKNKAKGFLILTDTFYPTWKVKLFNKDSGQISTPPIFRSDFTFRGVVIPPRKYNSYVL